MPLKPPPLSLLLMRHLGPSSRWAAIDQTADTQWPCNRRPVHSAEHAAPYRTVPHQTILYYTIPYWNVPYRTMLYRVIHNFTLPYCTIVGFSILYHTVYIFILTRGILENTSLNLEYDILRVKTGIFLQGTTALMAPCMVLALCQN